MKTYQFLKATCRKYCPEGERRGHNPLVSVVERYPNPLYFTNDEMIAAMCSMDDLTNSHCVYNEYLYDTFRESFTDEKIEEHIKVNGEIRLMLLYKAVDDQEGKFFPEIFDPNSSSDERDVHWEQLYTFDICETACNGYSAAVDVSTPEGQLKFYEMHKRACEEEYGDALIGWSVCYITMTPSV